jgi:hypothetical protein
LFSLVHSQFALNDKRFGVPVAGKGYIPYGETGERIVRRFTRLAAGRCRANGINILATGICHRATDNTYQ